MNTSSGRYYVKKKATDSFQDITTLFDGLAILKMDGLLGRGKPVNIYTAQWIDEQAEDFVIPKTDLNENAVVIRENVDIEITFIIRQKYASSLTAINLLSVHDSFVGYMTNSDVWIKSAYVGNKYVHCVCLSDYKPTIVNLERGSESYIMGTITLHSLDAPLNSV